MALAAAKAARIITVMVAERGASVDQATIHRWVIRYSAILLERFNLRKRAVTAKWHVDVQKKPNAQAEPRRSIGQRAVMALLRNPATKVVVFQ